MTGGNFEKKFPFKSFNDIHKKNIHIKDLADMYKSDIGENELKYIRIVKEHNNSYVENWYNTMLVKYANNNGEMTCTLGTDLWEVWNQGNEIRALMKLWDKLSIPSDDMVNMWRNVFDDDIQNLVSLGKDVVTMAFHIIMTGYSSWFVKEKYEKVFKNDDPMTWLDGYRKHNMLFTKKHEKFSIKTIHEKMQMVCINAFKTKIEENERYLHEQIKLYNKRFVEDFEISLKKNFEKVSSEQKNVLWKLWIHGHNTRAVNEMKKDFLIPSDECVEEWKKIFSQDIEHLVKLERPALTMGHHILGTVYNMWLSDQKYERVFKEDNLKIWYEKYQENKDLFERKEELFSMNNIINKVNAILSNPIKVRK